MVSGLCICMFLKASYQCLCALCVWHCSWGWNGYGTYGKHVATVMHCNLAVLSVGCGTGNGTTTQSNVPANITGSNLTNVVQLSSSQHSCAVFTNGGLRW